jgi:hypothetical protein
VKLVTLANLISIIRTRADAEAQTARHTDAWITTEINRSWTLFRSKLTRHGSPLFLKWSTPATTSVGPKVGYSFGEIPLPSDALEIFGIDLTISDASIRSLQPIPFAERNEFWSTFGQARGIPACFCVANLGTEAGATATDGAIQILPAPDRAYTYSIAYVPAWQDVTDPTYVFNSVGNWDEWVIWDVVLKIAGRDNDMLGTAAIAAQKQQQAWDEVIAPAASVQRVGATQKVDAARMRRGETPFYRRGH